MRVILTTEEILQQEANKAIDDIKNMLPWERLSEEAMQVERYVRRIVAAVIRRRD